MTDSCVATTQEDMKYRDLIVALSDPDGSDLALEAAAAIGTLILERERLRSAVAVGPDEDTINNLVCELDMECNATPGSLNIDMAKECVREHCRVSPQSKCPDDRKCEFDCKDSCALLGVPLRSPLTNNATPQGGIGTSATDAAVAPDGVAPHTRSTVATGDEAEVAERDGKIFDQISPELRRQFYINAAKVARRFEQENIRIVAECRAADRAADVAESRLSATAGVNAVQVVGRVYNDENQGEARLNSIGRKLPDGAPLFSTHDGQDVAYR